MHFCDELSIFKNPLQRTPPPGRQWTCRLPPSPLQEIFSILGTFSTKPLGTLDAIVFVSFWKHVRDTLVSKIKATLGWTTLQNRWRGEGSCLQVHWVFSAHFRRNPSAHLTQLSLWVSENMCGTHLFPKLKQYSGGQRLKTDEEVKEAVCKFIDGLAAEFYEEGFQMWITRQQKLVEKSGDYLDR